MYGDIKSHLKNEIESIKDAGLFKEERIITSPQGAEITLNTGQKVLNFCANNYLGLSSHPEVVQAAKDTMDTHGFWYVFRTIHLWHNKIFIKHLSKRLPIFMVLKILYYTQLLLMQMVVFFEPLLTKEDAIISDSLNHASIIDGVRLCKAARYRYQNNDMADLEKQLISANDNGARFKIIVTDGVFSMDGLVAPLDEICDLADKYDAMVMIDECHATGFIGETGIGTLEEKGVLGRIDIITGTLGKAMGGAMGGYTSAKKEIIEIFTSTFKTIFVFELVSTSNCWSFY